MDKVFIVYDDLYGNGEAVYIVGVYYSKKVAKKVLVELKAYAGKRSNAFYMDEHDLF